MDINKIREFLELIEESELEELELEVREKNGSSIRIRKGTPEGSSSIINSVLGPTNAGLPQTTPQAAVSDAANQPGPVGTGVVVETSEEVAAGGDSGFVEITSPIVGTFYRAPASDAEPYTKIGDHIEVGQVVCIVEAMKLMNEIQSEVSGEVVKILVENAEPVEFGQVMFQIKPY